MLLSYKRGQASVVLRLKILDSSVATGAGKTGLTEATSGLIIGTIADNEATTTRYRASSSEVETIGTLGTYVAPTSGKCRFKEVDSGNHPGVYEIQLADARFAVSSAKSLLVSLSGAANAAQCDVVIPLNLAVDVTSLSDDQGAADNAEAFFDGTGYAGTNNVIPMVTTLTGNVEGDLEGSVQGDVEGDLYGSVLTDVEGSLLGNVMGNVLGDLYGSVLADVWGRVLGNSVTVFVGVGVQAQLGTNTYQAKVIWIDDDSGGTDRYLVCFFKNGELQISGITLPTIAVVNESGGVQIATVALDPIGASGYYKFDASSGRLTSGAGYVATIGWTQDAATHAWAQPVGRPSS